MKCKRCLKNHDGKFGSGMYCSRSCANKREYDSARKLQVYTKVKNTLAITNASKYAAWEKICPVCNVKYFHYKNKTCSLVCSRKLAHRTEIREEQSRKTALRIMLDPSYAKRLKTIRCEFEFNGSMIRCDSKIEFACLDYVTKNFDIISLKRCDFIIPFQFDDITRHYVPDFIFVTSNNTYVVEAKCEFVNQHLRTKWRYYYETIPYKRIALQKFCDEHSYTALYFNRSMHRKFYETCKPTV